MVDAFCAVFSASGASAAVVSSSGDSVADGSADALCEGYDAPPPAAGSDAPRQSDHAHASTIATISSASASRYILR